MDLGSILGRLEADADLARLLEVLTDNGRQLALLDRLQGLLDEVASGLAGSGEQARSAAVPFLGEGGAEGLHDLLQGSSEVLAGLVTTIGLAADLIAARGPADVE